MIDAANFVTYGAFSAVCAIISAKWAAEQGFSQLSQLLWAIFALALPPVALLVLYVRELHERKAKGLPGANWA
jgi:phage tail protein X